MVVGMDIQGVLLDLDGTVYYGTQEIPGASDFVRAAHDRGVRTMFVTNRSNRTPAEVVRHLEDYGIPCTEDEVLTSSQATAQYLKSGSFYHIGEYGLELALTEQGLIYDEEAPDYVIVSYDREFNYNKLQTACRLIGNGSRFIATNPDSALKLKHGLAPGTGAIVAAVQAGTNTQPLIVGKPERLIFDLAVERIGVERGRVVAVGDSLHTDIPAGQAAGIRSALILTGVSSREDIAAAPVEPTWVVENYAELTALVLDDDGR